MIFVSCGNQKGIFLRVARKRRQSLSGSVSCSVMLSTNSHSSKSFLNVATREREKSLQTHVVAVGRYWPTSVCDALHHHASFGSNARTSVSTPEADFFFYDPMRLRCQAIFVVLVRFIIERQDVAALQPGDAGGGLGQLKCLLCWLIMSAMLTKHSNKALTLPFIKS